MLLGGLWTVRLAAVVHLVASPPCQGGANTVKVSFSIPEVCAARPTLSKPMPIVDPQHGSYLLHLGQSTAKTLGQLALRLPWACGAAKTPLQVGGPAATWASWIQQRVILAVKPPLPTAKERGGLAWEMVQAIPPSGSLAKGWKRGVGGA